MSFWSICPAYFSWLLINLRMTDFDCLRMELTYFLAIYPSGLSSWVNIWKTKMKHISQTAFFFAPMCHIIIYTSILLENLCYLLIFNIILCLLFIQFRICKLSDDISDLFFLFLNQYFIFYLWILEYKKFRWYFRFLKLFKIII